ncbi:MAG: hypothetical protein EP303_03160, partial [Deltaproteobacteria bacterium]
MRRFAAVFGVVIALMASTSVSAQELNIERFRPTLDRFGFLGMQGSATPGHARWNLGLFTWYSNRPLRIRYADGTGEQVIDNRMTGDLFFEVGLFGRWSLALEVPLVLYQNGETARPVNGRTSFTGFAVEDPRFTTKVRFFGEKTAQTQSRPDGPGLALLLTIPVPIGSSSLYASEGQFSFDAQFVGDFHLLGAGAGMILGWRYRVNERNFGVDSLWQEFQYGFSLKPPIPPAKDLFGLLELRGTTAFRGRSTNTLEGDLGVRWTKNEVTMTAAIGMGFVR